MVCFFFLHLFEHEVNHCKSPVAPTIFDTRWSVFTELKLLHLTKECIFLLS